MTRTLRCLVALCLALLITDATALAQRGRSQARSGARQSVTRDTSANRNVNRNVNQNVNRDVNRNVNRDIDIDRDIDVDIDDRRYGCCYHSGWGTAAAVATAGIVTAAVVGSVVNTLPASCSVVVVNGFSYQQCGSTWYQPQLSGSSTTYIVVDPPR